MKKANGGIDMLNGPLAKKILLFTLPVALSNMVQQLFNAAALPAVGTMIGTCAFRITWIYTVFRVHPTLETLYHAFPLSWVLTVILILCGFAVIKPLKNRGE